MIKHPHRARRRTLLTGASAAAALGAAAACSDDGPAGTADDPIELGFEWWGNDVRADLTQQAVDLFEERNEGITVRTNFSDYGPYWEGLTGRMASQNLPDVFQMDYPRLRQFGGTGLLTPLDDLIDTAAFREQSLLETGRIDGELVAVPVAANTLGLVYRADLFDQFGIEVPEAGYSWDDYAELATRLSTEMGEGFWGAEDWTHSYLFLELWLRQRGLAFYDVEANTLGFTQAELVEYWEMVFPLVEAGHVPKATEVSDLESDGVTEGVMGTMIRWDSILGGIAPTAEENGGPLGLTAPPTSDPDNLGTFLKPSMQFVVAANSEYPEESAKLIDFLLNDPDAVAILGTNRGIPSTQSGLDNIELDQYSQQVMDYEESIADYLDPPPPAPPAAAGAIESKYIEIHEQVQYEEMTAVEAADQFFIEAETLFASEQ